MQFIIDPKFTGLGGLGDGGRPRPVRVQREAQEMLRRAWVTTGAGSTSYNDLVNVPITEKPMLERVKPGDPMDSYLVIHLEKDGDGAPASNIPFVIQWIMGGALPGNSAMPMEAEFKVNAVEPNPGDTLQSSPPRIIIGFTRELDTIAVNAASMRLKLIDDDSDAPIAKTITIPVSVSIPTHNARALILTPAAALPTGQYQVVFILDSSVAVRSLSGASLGIPAPNDRRERIVTNARDIRRPGNGNVRESP